MEIIPNNVEQKGSRIECQFASEDGDIIYLEGLEGSLFHYRPSIKSDIELKQILFQIGPIKYRNQKHLELANQNSAIFH